ncbi:hypothetical protein JRO89_XS02G0006300 [Xanthoceras sorbifolium]|uniref:Flavin-containing monooxygenase n=1 Tax=Xanthoceras sorbifolium TaxID=99658 RepID=A0ABQ8IDV9_9ROSI|nr:hypothetical protein JRO89_XS02G0006300 [Xanthoceras sorbifolium]
MEKKKIGIIGASTSGFLAFTEDFPTQHQVFDYIQSYAQYFDLIKHIRLNTKVIGIEYDHHHQGLPDDELEMFRSWKLWNGDGQPFQAEGKWKFFVEDTLNNSKEECTVSYRSFQVYKVDFVILCVGRFSDVPNISEFPLKKGPEAFHGKVINSMDYAAMDYQSAANFVKGKRVIVVGFRKSALDIAMECSVANEGILVDGGEEAITTPLKTDLVILATGFRGDKKLKDIFLHVYTHNKIENFIRYQYAWLTPIHKTSKCMISSSLGFKMQQMAVLLDAKTIYERYKTNVKVYKTHIKVKSIKIGYYAKDLICLITHLIREIIHPRIPQLAVIGFSESYSNLFTSEMRVRWLAELLDVTFKLPSIKEMENDIMEWDQYMKRYSGRFYRILGHVLQYRRSCIGALHIWYNDQLCKDMGWNLKRKNGFFTKLFEPYGPLDYVPVPSMSN